MKLAICFKCGAEKSSAMIACRHCGFSPKAIGEFAVSLALSDNLSSKEELAKYSHEIRNHLQLSVPRESIAQASEALKDPQLLAMLGAQTSILSSTAPAQADKPPANATPQQQSASRIFQPGLDGRVTYNSGQSFDENIFKKIQPRLMELMVLKIQKYPILLQDQALLPKVDVQFMSIYEAMETTHSLEQIIEESFKRAFPPNGIPQSGEAGANAPIPSTAHQSTAPRSIPSKPSTNLTKSALHQSPFAVLGVTTRDDRRRIIEQAEERSLDLDHDICQKARSDLTNPRTRLGAEIAWLPGVSPRKASQLLDSLLDNPMALREESALPTLAHLNLMAASFESIDAEHEKDHLAEFIHEIAYLVDDLSSDEVLRDINEDRTVSGFPQLTSLDQIEIELTERKLRYRNAIKSALDRLPPLTLVQVMIDAVDGATAGGEVHAPWLIDDLVDNYEVETQGILQKEAENVHKLIKDVRGSAVSGEPAVKSHLDKLCAVARNWDKIAQPIQLSAKARGIDHKPSGDLAWAIRRLALDLFNDHKMLTPSQQLTGLLQTLFAEVPDVAEKVEEDAEALESIASNRRNLTKKFKDFNLTDNSFTYNGKSYEIHEISHIGYHRAITTHKTNFVETGKTEKVILTLKFPSGKNINISIDEQGVLFNNNKSQQIRVVADFYLHLCRVTFDRRTKFYESQIERNGYFVYDECCFYPRNKVVFRGREFGVSSTSFLRSYGFIEMRKKDFGVMDKIIREVSLTKIPQFNTTTDTDVIFHLLDKHFGLRWGS